MKRTSAPPADAPLTAAERRVLEVLAKSPPLGCGTLGNYVWGHLRRGHVCSAPFARIAGKTVRRLQKRDFVRYVEIGNGWYGWTISASGRAALARKPAEPTS